jgi:dolichol-phosphate mannosyltransferase
MKVSVILPAYNEVGNILRLVNELKTYLANTPHEIVVVDDNSPDGTYQAAVDRFAGDESVVCILRTTDRGLAKSIRTGIERSTGELIVIMDTDFAHNPKEVPKMVHLLGVCELVIGSRFCAGGLMVYRPHYYLSMLYNWMLRLVLRTQIQDNLSGFLGMHRRVLDCLNPDEIFFGYGDYCFRLLHLAQRSQPIQILEMPVQYADRSSGTSKSVFWKLFIDYTRQLIRIRTKTLRSRHLRKDSGEAVRSD